MMRRILSRLGSLRVTVAGLLLLLILTVWGTVYQVEHGLYGAQVRFYQSWWVMIGDVVPFPGAQLVMTILFVNLVASILLLTFHGRFRWSFLITHAGLLLMLSAGAVTFYFGRESHLSLLEGEGSNVAESYNEWELALLSPGSSSSRSVSALPLRDLKPGRVVEMPVGKFSIRVDEVYRNCQAMRGSDEGAPFSSGRFTGLERQKPNKEPGADRPGLVFTLLEKGAEKGRYLVWAADPGPTPLKGYQNGVGISLRRERLPLPALIELVDFKRELHPGSGIAKSYSSKVVIKSGEDADRTVVISMNKPLRLQGYTFYQSSFASGPGGREMSTLSVVHNYGRTMPYWATGLTVLGMMMYFTGMLIMRLRQRVPAEVGV